MRMMSLALMLMLCACAKTDAVAEEPVVVVVDTPAEAFLRGLDFDSERWIRLEVSGSLVTGTTRRISFDKDAAVTALLAWRGGSGRTAAPMPWADGTVFVAQSLSADGSVHDTEVLITRNGPPDFRLFDHEGRVSDTFAQPGDPPGGPRRGNVPVVCAGCHNGTGFFPPMMNYPQEPPIHAVTIAPGARDQRIIEHFLEGFHRSHGTFGPYAGMLLSTLRQGLLDGTLSAADRRRAERLSVRYADLLGAVR